MPGNTSSAAASVVPKSTGETQLGSVPRASAHFSQAASTHVVLCRNQQLPGDFSAGSRAGERKVAGCKPRQAGRQAAAAAAARMLCCKAEAELEKRAPTLCSEARGAAHVVNPLCALSCSVIHHPGKRQPFHCWHELFNSFF